MRGKSMDAKDYIYALGILVTIGLGVWNFIQVHRATRKSGFINTVTAQRVVWIEQLRQDVSRFVGLTHSWAMSSPQEGSTDHELLKELDRLRYVIRLRLNPDDPPDLRICSLVKRIPDLTHVSMRKELMAALEDLTAATQEMLKAEWEKVKNESKDGDLKDKSGKRKNLLNLDNAD